MGSNGKEIFKSQSWLQNQTPHTTSRENAGQLLNYSTLQVPLRWSGGNNNTHPVRLYWELNEIWSIIHDKYLENAQNSAVIVDIVTFSLVSFRKLEGKINSSAKDCTAGKVVVVTTSQANALCTWGLLWTAWPASTLTQGSWPCRPGLPRYQADL